MSGALAGWLSARAREQGQRGGGGCCCGSCCVWQGRPAGATSRRLQRCSRLAPLLIPLSACPVPTPAFAPDLALPFFPPLLAPSKTSTSSFHLPCPRSTLKMTDDVLCVRVSPNGKLLAASLLDSTVRVFFLDSLKFFLSLYGHKLPVLSMDISSGGWEGLTLLAGGSVWGNGGGKAQVRTQHF